MGIEAIISTILTTGISVVPRLMGLFTEWHALGGKDATPEQVDALWQRIKIAEDRIDAAAASRGIN